MLNERHIRNLAAFFVLCCFLNQLWFIYHGLTLFQYDPVFFSNKLDLTGNILMAFRFHEGLLHSPVLCIVADTLFLALPAVLLWCVLRQSKVTSIAAILCGLYNMAYAWFISLFTWVSIEVYSAFIFIPFLFASNESKNRFYLLHIIRYIFLLIFFSTAWWKWRTGSIFNQEQFSAILLQQQSAYLAGNPQSFYADVIRLFISHPVYSFIVYWIVFVGEALFAIGFFTRRFDKILAVMFVAFVILDYFIMKINYFTWLPFLGCLWYSRKRIPA